MRKNILNLFANLFILFVIVLFVSWKNSAKQSREFYQLTVYNFSTNKQEGVLDNYFKNALLPALHKMGINNVGIFKNIANDTSAAKSMFVFIPMKSLNMVLKLPAKLEDDKVYQLSGAEYIYAAADSPPYTRMEVILLQAFPLAPQMQLPALKGDRKERVYELRSYESYTEKIYKNKVKMFNEGGEIELFKKLNFNAVFYSEVIAGSKMPNLMYMTTFENMAERDAHWKSFSDDPDWKKLSAMPEYQKNVSKNVKMFLRPTEYSDF